MTGLERIEHIKKSPFKLWDIAVYAVSAGLIVLLTLLAFAGTGEEVVISRSGGNKQRYPLSENRTVALSEGLTVRIENGYVWVESAQCPDKVCVRSGRINRPNQVLVCVPLGVVIEISGEGKLDAGSGQSRTVFATGGRL